LAVDWKANFLADYLVPQNGCWAQSLEGLHLDPVWHRICRNKLRVTKNQNARSQKILLSSWIAKRLGDHVRVLVLSHGGRG